MGQICIFDVRIIIEVLLVVYGYGVIVIDLIYLEFVLVLFLFSIFFNVFFVGIMCEVL